MKVAPVVLFTYKRLDVLMKTVIALQNNFLAKDTDLIIFSDGPINDQDKKKVDLVRSYIKTIKGFKTIKVFNSDINNGLAKSIIDGISQILNLHENVIVLEDDLVAGPNFLNYMNQCLEKYENNRNVFSISGYTPPFKQIDGYPYDVYFYSRNSSHGWAIWKDRWKQVDWKVSDYATFINDKKQIREFNKIGSDLTSMLMKQMDGKIDSWSIRLCYFQFKNKKYTVYPIISKIQNIGFSKEATNTKNNNRFRTIIDSSKKMVFNLPDKVEENKIYSENLKKFYSIKSRAIGKFQTLLNKLNLIKLKLPII